MSSYGLISAYRQINTNPQVSHINKMKTVTIVTAIYNPDLTFFEKQLKSLNGQTYNNITLLFIDDCSDNTDDQRQILFSFGNYNRR